MTTIAMELPHRQLTVADYLALPEWPDQHWELLEGNLVMTAYASAPHNHAVIEILSALRSAAPPEVVAIHEIETDLQLVPDAEPGTVRRPDVVVMTRNEYERLKRERGFLRPAATLLAVEVMSPGSRRTDRLIKLAEYADAGIPHYWIVDLDGGPLLFANRLVDGRYEQSEPSSGTFTTDVPFPVSVNLAALV